MRRELLSQTSGQQTYTLDCNANQQHIGILAYNLQVISTLTATKQPTTTNIIINM